MDAVRFFVVSVAGVVLDLSIAWALATALGVPLWLAAIAGFATAATANYAAHELWTFRRAGHGLSTRRAGQYVGASAATLATRLVAVEALRRVVPDDLTLAILTGAAGVSFLGNFAISRFLIFRPTHSEPTP